MVDVMFARPLERRVVGTMVRYCSTVGVDLKKLEDLKSIPRSVWQLVDSNTPFYGDVSRRIAVHSIKNIYLYE